MPDYKVTLTRTVMLKGVPKPLQLAHVVEDVPRPLAVLKSIGEIFEQEAENGFHLVPKEAVDFWHEARTSGSLQEYELLSELENRWGITSGIKDLSEVPSPAPQEHRNGTAEPEISDLDTMLTKHLKALQSRNAVLSAELERKQAEYDRNNADIMRISTMIIVTKPLPLADDSRARIIETAPPKKRRGRPPKAEANAQ